MPRKRGDRLYKKRRRWYADFRDYKDVGGRQEALVRKGERYGTTNRKVAVRLAKARLAELRRLRKAGHGGREDDLRMLGPFVDYHLEREARRKGADVAHLAQVAQRLEVAVEYFGEATLIRAIGTIELQAYVEYLANRVRWEGRENPGAEKIAATTQRKYLSALAKAFRRARAVHVTPRSHRPFADLMDLPEPDDDPEAGRRDPSPIVVGRSFAGGGVERHSPRSLAWREPPGVGEPLGRIGAGYTGTLAWRRS